MTILEMIKSDPVCFGYHLIMTLLSIAVVCLVFAIVSDDEGDKRDENKDRDE